MANVRIHGPNASWTYRLSDEEAARLLETFYAGLPMTVVIPKPEDNNPFGPTPGTFRFNSQLIVLVEVTD